MNVRDEIYAERAELVELLRTLTPDEWDAPSLCSGWCVRDVVAHIATDAVPLSKYVIAAVRNVSPDRINQHFVDAARGAPTDELIARLAHSARTSWVTTMMPNVALADHLIHQQDIRRPLHRPRAIAPGRLRHVLTHPDPFVPSRKNSKGLRLVASDLDWASGSGPEVHGTAEALILAAAGRTPVLDELSGAGVEILSTRLGRT